MLWNQKFHKESFASHPKTMCDHVDNRTSVENCNAGDDGKKYYSQLFGLFQRPDSHNKKGVFHVYDLGVASADRLAKRASRPQRARQGFDPPRRWIVSCAETMQTKRHVLCQMGHHATQSYLEKPKYFTILVTTVKVSSVQRKGTEMVARCWCTLVALMGCGSLQSRLFTTV